MRSFALKCLTFAALLGATAALAEFKLRSVSDKYSAKRKHFEAGLHEWQVIITGSSPEENGIDTGRLAAPAFNLATIAQPLYYDAQLISKYIDRLDRLRMVIVGVSYLTLEYDLSNSDDGRAFFYRRAWGIPLQPDASSRLDLRKYSLLAVYSPQSTFDLALRRFHMDASDRIDANGWDHSLNGHEFGTSEALAKDIIAKHHNAMKDSVLPANIALLDRLFTLLRTRNIEVTVIKMPVSQAYFEAEKPARRIAMDTALTTVCRRHSITLHDYSRDGRIGPNDLFNSAHLNIHGAERFSKIIDEEIVRPIFAVNREDGRRANHGT
jgi:hypothetical protein